MSLRTEYKPRKLVPLAALRKHVRKLKGRDHQKIFF